MAIVDDWFYTELNNIRHKWQQFVTSSFIVGGRVAVDGTVTSTISGRVVLEDGLAAARAGRNI